MLGRRSGGQSTEETEVHAPRMKDTGPMHSPSRAAAVISCGSCLGSPGIKGGWRRRQKDCCSEFPWNGKGREVTLKYCQAIHTASAVWASVASANSRRPEAFGERPSRLSRPQLSTPWPSVSKSLSLLLRPFLKAHSPSH